MVTGQDSDLLRSLLAVAEDHLANGARFQESIDLDLGELVLRVAGLVQPVGASDILKGIAAEELADVAERFGCHADPATWDRRVDGRGAHAVAEGDGGVFADLVAESHENIAVGAKA